MNVINRTVLLLTFAAAVALPTLAKAEEAAPAASAPATAATAPMPGMGMGPGMGMRHGAMHAEHCDMPKGGMMGDGKPCMMGQHHGCRVGGGGMTDKRLDMLEKRMDMMQMMMQMMMQQSSDTNP